MNPPSFKIGDRVKVIGPSIHDSEGHAGEVFEIQALSETGNIPYNPYDGKYYSPSSLEVVDELQIGDLVEAIGPAFRGQSDDLGHVFKIEQVTDDGCFWAHDEYNYPASSLRKIPNISPEQWEKLADSIATTIRTALAGRVRKNNAPTKFSLTLKGGAVPETNTVNITQEQYDHLWMRYIRPKALEEGWV